MQVGKAPPGFRLPDATQVGRVKLQVASLDRSISYYQRVLGLEVGRRGNGTATLTPAGDNRVIVELVEKPGVRAVPRRGLLGLYHFAVLLPDRAALGRFLAHLAELGEHAGMSDHLVSEAIYLTDPDGLGIEVYADRPRDSWDITDGQIAMATSPLDAESVIASAKGESWSGAPRGTKMGHVHFHVGDITEAERFYHEGLGLDKIVWNYPGALFMSAGGYHHHIGTNTWAAGSPTATDNDARLLDWELVLPDETGVEGAANSLEKAGFVAERVDGAVLVNDPWGIRVRLVAA
ncbi:MAG TPA: VOC family protein [Gemmatimonadaceae bacterium]|nr:VOC family protein [Gemmatimonadaceae bacterium]